MYKRQKFDKVASAARYAPYASSVSSEFASTPILETARKELAIGLKGLTGVTPTIKAANGTIHFVKDPSLKEDAFSIIVGPQIQIKASSDRGILYGVFELLRMIQQEKPLANISSSPKVKFRMLNHWDLSLIHI